MLCDVIGQTGADGQWKRECFRVVGDSEKPLLLQSLWKPKEGFSRRFEIQLRANVEEQSLQERDAVTAGKPQPPPTALIVLHSQGGWGGSCRARDTPPFPVHFLWFCCF